MASGRPDEAHEHLLAALAIFDRLEARYETACTHLDMADLARRIGNRDSLTIHRDVARNLFELMDLPDWAARAGAFETAGEEMI